MILTHSGDTAQILLHLLEVGLCQAMNRLIKLILYPAMSK